MIVITVIVITVIVITVIVITVIVITVIFIAVIVITKFDQFSTFRLAFFQKPKAAITNEASSSNVNKKSGNATDGNNGGNGHSRRQDLNTGIAPVALPEEMNDIQVRRWVNAIISGNVNDCNQLAILPDVSQI